MIMGQPGANDAHYTSGGSCGSSPTYYFQCYDCRAYSGEYLGNDVGVENCKHKGKFREYSSNGGCCNGYEAGQTNPDITVPQKIIRQYISLIDHIFKCSYYDPYSIEEFDFDQRGVWSGPDRRATLKRNKLTVEQDGNIFLRLKDGSPYYRKILSW
jgi:hypothetical protein